MYAIFNAFFIYFWCPVVSEVGYLQGQSSHCWLQSEGMHFSVNQVYTINCFLILYICWFSDNVNEYLKLAANADKQQLLRIKAVFEKKNQKSAHSISQLQKKLDGYHKRINNWEVNHHYLY